MELLRAGQCRCLVCQRVLPLSDVCLVGFSNDIAASFCLDCFAEGRAFSVTRTHDGIGVQIIGDAPASRIVVPHLNVPDITRRG